MFIKSSYLISLTLLFSIIFSCNLYSKEAITHISIDPVKISIKNHDLVKILTTNIKEQEFIFPGIINPSDKLSGFTLANFNKHNFKDTIVSFQLHNSKYWEHYEWIPYEHTYTYARSILKDNTTTFELDSKSSKKETKYKSYSRHLIESLIKKDNFLDSSGSHTNPIYKLKMPWFKKEIYNSDNVIISTAIDKNKNKIYSLEYNEKSKTVSIIDVYSQKILHEFDGKAYKSLKNVPEALFFDSGRLYFKENCKIGSPIKALNTLNNSIEWTMMLAREDCYLQTTFTSDSGKMEVITYSKKQGYNKPTLVLKDNVNSITTDILIPKTVDYNSNRELFNAESFMFNEVNWNSDETAFYFDNSGIAACIWRYQLGSNILEKLVPEHQARLPRWFTKDNQDWITFVINNQIFIANQRPQLDDVISY